MKEPHTALFIAPTGVGKTHLALSLLENEYRNHFNFIVIICPTLAHNETYRHRGWVWNNPDVIPIEPRNRPYYLIEKIGDLLAGSVTLFLIDDIIADEALDKRRQPLSELATSGRHRQHSLWLLTQSYTAIPNNIRRQAKMLYVWYPKNRTDLNIIHEENDVIEMGELANVKEKLKRGKHTCLIMRMEHARAYGVAEQPWAHGALQCIEFYNRTVIRLLSRDCKTTINLLSRDYRTPVNRLWVSYQEITGLL